MDVKTLSTVLSKRRMLRKHEQWDRRALEERQAGLLRELRDFATARSPFYRALHAGLERRPLHELPVVTKATLMDHWNDVVTVPELDRTRVDQHLDAMRAHDAPRPLDGRYFVTATSGTTGHRGVFVQDSDEWSWVIASYARANEWAGIRAGLTHRTRLAVVSSRTPWHQSALVGATVDSRFVPTLRLDSTEPLTAIVRRLNEFRPEVLVGYSSMIRLLADEQLVGRLRIAPRSVMCSSEPVTDAIREKVRAAFGHLPFEVYAATEPAGIAAHCERHRMHLFEDLVIAELVDENDRPVPPGIFGARVLVTVLFSRTMPLIRYAMSDSVCLSTETCPCGRPFGLIGEIQGRREDSLELPGTQGGRVIVQPNVFHGAMELFPVRAWQVVQESGSLRVHVVAGPAGLDLPAVERTLDAALRAAGASVKLVVDEVTEIAKTPMGKSPLIVRGT